MVQIMLEKSVSQIPGKEFYFCSIFLISSYGITFSSFKVIIKKKPLPFDLWRVRYKIGQIIAIPQIHSILHFLNL